MTFTQGNNSNPAVSQSLQFNPWPATPQYNTGILQGTSAIVFPLVPYNSNNLNSYRWCQATNGNTTADQGTLLQPANAPTLHAKLACMAPCG